MIFVDPLDKESDELERPLRKFGLTIDLTKFKQETKQNLKKKFKYDLIGILSHKREMYTATVKKRIADQDKKEWLTFCQSEMHKITDEENLKKLPAQVLFYTLNMK